MKTDRNAPIGVFDSGVGGLTVAREIMRNLPMENRILRRYRTRSLWKQIQRNRYSVLQTDRPIPAKTGRKSNCDRLQYSQCAGT